MNRYTVKIKEFVNELGNELGKSIHTYIHTYMFNISLLAVKCAMVVYASVPSRQIFYLKLNCVEYLLTNMRIAAKKLLFIKSLVHFD